MRRGGMPFRNALYVSVLLRPFDDLRFGKAGSHEVYADAVLCALVGDRPRGTQQLCFAGRTGGAIAQRGKNRGQPDDDDRAAGVGEELAETVREIDPRVEIASIASQCSVS